MRRHGSVARWREYRLSESTALPFLLHPPFGRVGSEALRASGEGLCSVVDASTPLPDGSQSLAVEPPKRRVKQKREAR
jgi:hypothetical protein